MRINADKPQTLSPIVKKVFFSGESMENFQVRTDLALEATESMDKADGRLRGVKVEEYYLEEEDIRVTKVFIETKNAAKTMGKPVGTYVTMEAPALIEPDEDYHREIAECLAKELLQILPNADEEQSILVVGLGNREVTADALGPQVVDNLYVTRHIVREYGKAAYNCRKMHQISALEPGVMAKTGMETAEIVKGVVVIYMNPSYSKQYQLNVDCDRVFFFAVP